MMSVTTYLIRKAKPENLEALLKAVLARYAEVFPGWEVSVITVDKQRDRNAQIDEIIAVLNGMKE